MNTMMLLLLLLLPPPQASAGCSPSNVGQQDDQDRKANASDMSTECQLLGKCSDGGRCVCAPGFTGTDCGQLKLRPAASLTAATLWPVAGAANSSSWGFTVAYDPADQLYHAVADVSCGCGLHSAVRECTEFTGVLASGGYASSLVHLTSTRPDGGFELASLLAPATSFNPHLVIAPDGAFALYFRVNAVNQLPFCGGNSSGPTPLMQGDCSLIKRCVGSSTDNCIHAGGAESGTNMYVATAPKMTGPWGVRSVGVVGEFKQHVSNPSVAYIRPGTPASKLGKIVMAFRYNSPHGETNGVAYAERPEGPFNAIANLTCRGCECVHTLAHHATAVHALPALPHLSNQILHLHCRAA